MRRLHLCLLLSLCIPTLSFAQTKYPFQNPGLPTEQRVDNLLSLMMLQEKIDALSTDPDVPRLDVHGSGHIEGLHGVAGAGPSYYVEGQRKSLLKKGPGTQQTPPIR